jgi:hypothetical protein
MAKEQKKSFFLKKNVVAIFGVAALIFGVYFVNIGVDFVGITGNVVVSETPSLLNMFTLIGILLIVCAGILIIYSIVKEE